MVSLGGSFNVARRLGMIADDLTGAIDAAGALGSPNDTVAVVWSLAQSDSNGKVSLDTESRSTSAEESCERLRVALPVVARSELTFKKVDSLIRGNTIVELENCCSSGLFGTVIVAPAFPAQSRVTRAGQQFARHSDGSWRAAGPNLVDAMAVSGLKCRLIERSMPPAGGGVMICDADSDGDLGRLMAARHRLEAPVLWCGSAGLARALGTPVPIAVPKGRRRLAVIGSTHWMTVSQIESLAPAAPTAIATVKSPSEMEAAVASIEAKLAANSFAALAFATFGQDLAQTAMLQTATFDLLRRLERPDVLVAVGGDTLYRLSNSLGATRIDTLGEWMPGIAVSALADGIWAGAQVISKSGAFGASDFLVRAQIMTEGH